MKWLIVCLTADVPTGMFAYIFDGIDVARFISIFIISVFLSTLLYMFSSTINK